MLTLLCNNLDGSHLNHRPPPLFHGPERIHPNYSVFIRSYPILSYSTDSYHAITLIKLNSLMYPHEP